MDRMNIIKIREQLMPNEKLMLENMGSIKVFLCNCRGEYTPEFFYKQRMITIIEGSMKVRLNDKVETFSKGDFAYIDSNDKCVIEESDALILIIVENK